LCIMIDKMPAASGTVKITASGNQLCGSFSTSLTDATPEIKTASSSTNNTVTFAFSNATEEAKGVFYLPVATGNYSLKIEVSDGTKLSTTTSSVEMKRTRLQVVNVTAKYYDDGVDYSKTINGHKFVDLGLPSRLLWAETNIGAETAADDGNYYAWGETKTKDSYSWDTYTYGSSSSDLTKYTSDDNKTVLENSDDAAYVIWGSSCRMPTVAEFDELCDTDNCTWTWTSKTTSSNETINGYEVTSKKNGNSIFLPASGCRISSNLYYHGSSGSYWSSTLDSSSTSDACGLYFLSDRFFSGISYRYYGHTVRPVAEP
jgi:hypothetical protein